MSISDFLKNLGASKAFLKANQLANALDVTKAGFTSSDAALKALTKADQVANAVDTTKAGLQSNDAALKTAFSAQTQAALNTGVAVVQVQAVANRPIPIVQPTISGALIAGSTLTINPGMWLNNPTSFRHQWYRDGVAIPGATRAQLTNIPTGVISCDITAYNSFNSQLNPSEKITISVSDAVIALHSKTAALLAAFTSGALAAPSDDMKTAYNFLFADLDAGNVTPRGDRLFIGVAEAAGHVYYDLLSATVGLTVTNAPTIAPGNGFYGNGTDQLFTTNLAPNAAGLRFKQDDASIGLYQFDNLNANVDDCGNPNNTIRSNYRPVGPETIPVRVNQSTTSSFSLPRSLVGAGLTLANRDSSTGLRVFKNKVRLTETTSGITSVATTASPMLWGGGRSTGNVQYGTRLQGALWFGGSLTDAQGYALNDALDRFFARARTTTLTLDVATLAQTLQGIAAEIQMDSIDGDAGGIYESNKTSLLLDLTDDEFARFMSEVIGLGAGFVDLRFAVFLYYRGTSADGKRTAERLPGLDAKLRKMADATGVKACYASWSKAPYFKKTANGALNGATYARPDPVTQSALFETWLRTLLQGGKLNAPDKVTQPAAYAAFMLDMATNEVMDMERIHANVIPIGKWTCQNEPDVSANYPSCQWTDEQMYDYLAVIVPMIRNSAILKTYNGQPNYIQIVSDDRGGQTGFGSTAIKNDATLLAQIDGWSWHKIDDCAKDANYVTDNAALLTSGAAGKPVWSSENEYFDLRCDPNQPTEYMEPGHRMANLAMNVLQWMRVVNSPIWYPIHVGKPSTGPLLESQGRAMTLWRPPGAPVRPDYPDLLEGHFDFVKVNWHAIKGFLEHMPRNSVRSTISAVSPRMERELYSMAWNKPSGKAVMCIVNRCRKSNGVKLTGLPAGTYRRYRYDLALASQDVGLVSAGQRFTIPADTIEFVVQQ